MRGVPDVACMVAFSNRHRKVRLRPSPVPARNGPIPHCIASRRIDLVKDSAGERGSWAHLRLRLVLWETFYCAIVCSTQASFGFCLHMFVRFMLWCVGINLPDFMSLKRRVVYQCLSALSRSLVSLLANRMLRRDPFVCLSLSHMSKPNKQPRRCSLDPVLQLHFILKQPRCTSQYSKSSRPSVHPSAQPASRRYAVGLLSSSSFSFFFSRCRVGLTSSFLLGGAAGRPVTCVLRWIGELMFLAYVACSMPFRRGCYILCMPCRTKAVWERIACCKRVVFVCPRNAYPCSRVENEQRI